MTIRYRDAGPQDAAALDGIFKTSFGGTFGHLYRAEDLHAFLAGFAIPGWEAQLRESDFAFRLAEVDGEAVGFVKMGPVNIPVEPAGPALVIYQFYVLKEHHGSGIAGVLMDWALAEARERSAVELYLTVFIDNHRARRFYERYGFIAVGRYDFMVGSQADEDIIMCKVL